MRYITENSAQTKKIGRELSKEILKNKKPGKAFIIGLKGELGGGKTTFLQGFAKGLGVKEKISSPTFVIMKRFKTARGLIFFHIDCYRIKKARELLDLGFKKIISDSKNIVAIEWADRIKKILPKNILWIRFKFINEKTREIIVK